MEEVISTMLDNAINSFDLSFCISANIATYITIKVITEYKRTKIATWNKRIIFLIVSVLLGLLYYFTGNDAKILINSFVLAPVSWSWIFKPICDKLNIGYSLENNKNSNV